MDITKILSSIKGIEDNSSKVEKDFIFFALSGLNTHGEKYIDQAIENGARYIVVDQNSKVEVKQNNVKIIKKVHSSILYSSLENQGLVRVICLMH